MSARLQDLTETIIFSDSDEFYVELDPGGARLPRRSKQQVLQRYLPMPQDSITGLVISNNSGDANNDIDISAGRALAGAGDYNLILTSALTKQLDAAWTVGTNQGGLDAGSKANSTWYHVWVIGRVDTHVVDVLFSTSVSAPTMPANYTKKRRIGAIKTDSSGNLLQFFLFGDCFMWKSPSTLDIDGTLAATRANYQLVSVPAGLVVEAIFNLEYIGAAARTVYLSNPNFTDLAPSTTAAPLAQTTTLSTNADSSVQRQYTDTSQNISARGSGIGTAFRIAVLGWNDPRGKW